MSTNFIKCPLCHTRLYEPWSQSQKYYTSQNNISITVIPVKYLSNVNIIPYMFMNDMRRIWVSGFIEFAVFRIIMLYIDI